MKFEHPAREDISLDAVLDAMADPVRRLIVKVLLTEPARASCRAVDCPLPKSTLSNHFRILRKAGLVHTERQGVENINTVRQADIEARFPGLLSALMRHVEFPEELKRKGF